MACESGETMKRRPRRNHTPAFKAKVASGLDIYSSCMTVAEYRALGRRRRCLVRLTNHPIVANLLLPPLVFLILYRLPSDAAKGWPGARPAVCLTNRPLPALTPPPSTPLPSARTAPL